MRFYPRASGVLLLGRVLDGFRRGRCGRPQGVRWRRDRDPGAGSTLRPSGQNKRHNTHKLFNLTAYALIYRVQEALRAGNNLSRCSGLADQPLHLGRRHIELAGSLSDA
jgi:hypothetical protein